MVSVQRGVPIATGPPRNPRGQYRRLALIGANEGQHVPAIYWLMNLRENRVYVGYADDIHLIRIALACWLVGSSEPKGSLIEVRADVDRLGIAAFRLQVVKVLAEGGWVPAPFVRAGIAIARRRGFVLYNHRLIGDGDVSQ